MKHEYFLIKIHISDIYVRIMLLCIIGVTGLLLARNSYANLIIR